MLDELSLLSYDGIEVAYPFVREFFTSDQLRKLVELHNMTISSTYSAIDFRTPESIIACERKARENIDYYSNAGAKHFLLDGQVEKPAHEPSMGYVLTILTNSLPKQQNVQTGSQNTQRNMACSYHGILTGELFLKTRKCSTSSGSKPILTW